MSEKKVYYGWFIVAACLALTVTDGLLLYSFGVFLPYLNEGFGFSRAEGSSVYSVRSVVFALSLIITGRLVDRYDPRAVIFGGGLIAVLGMLLSGFATVPWHLYVTYGVMVGLGDGVLYIPCVAVVSRWFAKKRALAIGIVTTGVPLSGLIVNPLSAWLISSFGVRNSFFILSGIIMCAIMAAFVIRGYPSDKNLKPYGEDEPKLPMGGNSLGEPPQSLNWSVREAVQTPMFWLMYSMYFLGFMTFLIVVIHLFNFAIDSGIPPLLASGAPAFIGVGSIIGRLTISGILTEYLEHRKVLFLCFLFQGSSLLILLCFGEIAAFYVFGAMFGFFYSGWVPMFPTLLGQFFGLRSLGGIYGVFGTSFCVAAVAGPPLAGYIHDIAGNYHYSFSLAVVFCYIAAGAAFFIKAPLRRASTARETMGENSI
ncbi:MAG: MFS transporter [Deltaproteobacteria bacterium]